MANLSSYTKTIGEDITLTTSDGTQLVDTSGGMAGSLLSVPTVSGPSLDKSTFLSLGDHNKTKDSIPTLHSQEQRPDDSKMKSLFTQEHLKLMLDEFENTRKASLSEFKNNDASENETNSPQTFKTSTQAFDTKSPLGLGIQHAGASNVIYTIEIRDKNFRIETGKMNFRTEMIDKGPICTPTYPKHLNIYSKADVFNISKWIINSLDYFHDTRFADIADIADIDDSHTSKILLGVNFAITHPPGDSAGKYKTGRQNPTDLLGEGDFRQALENEIKRHKLPFESFAFANNFKTITTMFLVEHELHNDYPPCRVVINIDDRIEDTISALYINPDKLDDKDTSHMINVDVTKWVMKSAPFDEDEISEKKSHGQLTFAQRCSPKGLLTIVWDYSKHYFDNQNTPNLELLKKRNISDGEVVHDRTADNDTGKIKPINRGSCSSNMTEKKPIVSLNKIIRTIDTSIAFRAILIVGCARATNKLDTDGVTVVLRDNVSCRNWKYVNRLTKEANSILRVEEKGKLRIYIKPSGSAQLVARLAGKYLASHQHPTQRESDNSKHYPNSPWTPVLGK